MLLRSASTYTTAKFMSELSGTNELQKELSANSNVLFYQTQTTKRKVDIYKSGDRDQGDIVEYYSENSRSTRKELYLKRVHSNRQKSAS
jgi:hypothetical protein